MKQTPKEMVEQYEAWQSERQARELANVGHNDVAIYDLNEIGDALEQEILEAETSREAAMLAAQQEMWRKLKARGVVAVVASENVLED